MKPLVFAIALLGVAAFSGPANAGPNCFGSETKQQTAEAPPPPPVPSPST